MNILNMNLPQLILRKPYYMKCISTSLSLPFVKLYKPSTLFVNKFMTSRPYCFLSNIN